MMEQDNKQTNENVANKKKMTVWKRILFAFECVIIVLCLVMSIIVFVNPGSVDENGKSNATMLTVQTDSMTPTIPVNALIFADKVPEGVLDLDTIVSFVVRINGQLALNTHRIVGYQYRNTNDPAQLHVAYWSIDGIKNEEDFYAQYPKSEGYEIVQYITRGDKFTNLYGDWNDYSIDNSTEEKIGWDDDALPLTGVVAVSQGKYIPGVGWFIDYIKTPLGVFLFIMLPIALLLIYQIVSLVRIIVKMNVAKVKEQSILSEEEIKKRAIEEYLKSQGLSAQSEGVNTDNSTMEEKSVEPVKTEESQTNEQKN